MLRLVSRIYDTLRNESGWQLLLNDLARSISGISWLSIRFDGRGAVLSAAIRPDPAWHLPTSPKSPDGGRLRFDIEYTPVGNAPPFLEDGSAGYLRSCPGRTSGSFGVREFRLLSLLLPHFRRALGIHADLMRLGPTAAAYLAAVNGLPYGVIMFDRARRPLFLNRYAQEVLDRSELLPAPEKRPTGSADSLVQIQRILRYVDESAVLGSSVIKVDRGSSRKPLILTAVRLPSRACGRLDAAHGALFLLDPEVAPTGSERAICSAFQLTRAETHVCCLLLIGLTGVQAAECLGIRANTLRTHLKRIFLKTNTSGQTELVCALLSRGAQAAVRLCAELDVVQRRRRARAGWTKHRER